MMKNKRRGFTVVELVIIIAVVAILAAVLIPTYVNLVKKSNEANAQVEAKNLISEMLTDIILGKEGDADLLVFSEKGSNVYAYAYSRTEGKIISYKEQFSNTTTFEGTVEAAIRKMLSDGAIRDLNVPEDDWRHPANVIKIVDSLSVNGKMIVYANYEVIADVFETHVHTWETAWTFDGTHHWHKCVGCDEITGKAEHDWESKTENNVKTDTCKVCHATKTEVISGDKTHHLFHHVAKAATCTEAGNIEYWECVDEGCGKYFSDSEAKNEITDKNSVKIPAKGHTPVPDAAVAATCIKSGLTAGTHCSVCHKVITPQTVIPATGEHTWDAGKVITPATCTTAGRKQHTCTVCRHTEDVTIPAPGHTVVKDHAVAATCSTKGKTEGSHCSVCNAVIKAQESTNIDPNNHESIKWKHKIGFKPSFDEKNKIFIANGSYSSMNYFFGFYGLNDREFTYVQLDWECDACKRKNDSVLEGGITFTDYKDSEGNPVKPDELKCGEIYEVTIKCDSQIISESRENGDEKIPHCNSEWKVKVYIDHWCVNNAFDRSIGEKCWYCDKIIESAPNTHIIGIETEGYLEDLTAGK